MKSIDEITASDPDFGWGTEAFTACPHRFGDAMREQDPVHHIEGTNTYLVSRWEDIATVLQQPSAFHVPESPRYWEARVDPDFPDVPKIRRYAPQSTVMSNGEDHKIKRSWGLRLVESSRLKAYEPMVAGITDTIIDEFIGDGECEFRWAFAEQLPARLIMSLLGLPLADVSIFRMDETGTEADYLIWNEYILAAVSERVNSPRDDFLSEILHEQINRDGGVDMDFQVVQGVNLVLAGAETTAHVLCSMMLLLCRDDDLMRRVREDRSLIRPLFEETMRIEAPVSFAPRVAVKDAQVGDVTIPAGSTLWLLLSSGNRDPDRWESPDEVRVDRPGLSKDQLGFGRGGHRCLGAPLARLEGAIGFNRLFDRLDKIVIDEKRSDLSNIMKEAPPTTECAYATRGIMHGPTKLFIHFDAK